MDEFEKEAQLSRVATDAYVAGYEKAIWRGYTEAEASVQASVAAMWAVNRQQLRWDAREEMS